MESGADGMRKVGIMFVDSGAVIQPI